jgi:hypothetical protein
MGKFKDLDAFDDVLDQHFSNDGGVKSGLNNYYKAQDPEYLQRIAEANRKTAQDPNWLEGQAQRNRAKRLDPNHIEKHLAAVQNEEYRAKMSVTMKASEAHKEGMKNRVNNSTWLESIQRITKDPVRNAKISQSNKRQIQTPYGIFPSMTEASEHMTSIGIGNSYKKLYKLMQRCPDEYFYTDGLGIQKVKPHKRK